MKSSLKKYIDYLKQEDKYKEEALFYMLPKPPCFSFVAFSIYYVHKDLLLSWFAEPLNIFQQIKHLCHIANNRFSKTTLVFMYFPFAVGSEGL